MSSGERREGLRRRFGRAGDGFRVEPVRGAASTIVGRLTGLEPRTSTVIARLSSPRPRRLRHRVVTTSDGGIAAVVAFKRLCFDVWSASVYLADPAAAAVVARVIDRSPARTVTGAAPDVLPLEGELRRWAGTVLAPRFDAPRPVGGIVDPPDDRTRVAASADLDGLVALFSTYELVPVPSVWQLRRYLSATLAADIVVVAVDGSAIVGAGVLGSRTEQYLTIADLVVRPDDRGRGWSAELLKRTAAVAGELGLGVTAALAPSNPMSFEHERVARSSDVEAHHCSIALGRRWRGQGWLRRQLARVGRIDRQRVDVFRDPSDPSRPSV